MFCFLTRKTKIYIVHVHTRTFMATKTITITEEAYNKLKIRKKGKESFSDVINRTMPYSDWEDLVGVLSKKSADNLMKSVEESRKSWDEPMRFIGKPKKVSH